jgi:hypothetical protein
VVVYNRYVMVYQDGAMVCSAGCIGKYGILCRHALAVVARKIVSTHPRVHSSAPFWKTEIAKTQQDLPFLPLFRETNEFPNPIDSINLLPTCTIHRGLNETPEYDLVQQHGGIHGPDTFQGRENDGVEMMMDLFAEDHSNHAPDPSLGIDPFDALMQQWTKNNHTLKSHFSAIHDTAAVQQAVDSQLELLNKLTMRQNITLNGHANPPIVSNVRGTGQR